MGKMFLRCHKRNKDGKQLRYWSVVENQRLRSGRVSQRTVLYLGDLNDQQRAAWRKSLDVLDENTASIDQYYLFPDDREIPEEVANALRVKLSAMELHRPRPFGNCWLGCELWDTLELGRFWKEHLPKGREHVPWAVVLELLVVNRLVEPGAEWWVHRHWFRESAMDELLGEDAAVAAKNRLYECLDVILKHREALFSHLKERWSALFEVKLFNQDNELYVLARSQGRQAKERAMRRRKLAKLWELYMRLVEIEAAFKSLKSDLVMRPINHQLDRRILAHIFVCFMAYCLQVTLKKRLKKHASGLTPRAVLEKLNLTLPKQPPPRIRAAPAPSASPVL